MKSSLRKALTKTTVVYRGRKLERVEVPPSERLVLAVYVTLTSIAGLTALEVAHLAFLGTWNSEIFAAITGLIGTVIGTLIGARA